MKCSLIITTYNWPEVLSMVINTAINQSVSPDEIIIADDGSSEKTTLLVEDFSKKSNIPIVHSWQEDKGHRLSRSRNLAISKSKYEYIISIDGDMLLHKDFVKDHKKFARKNFYIQGSRSLLQPDISNKILKSKKFEMVSIFSSNVKNKLNMLRIPLLSNLLYIPKSRNIERIRGCNFSLFKSDILKVNGFNEDIQTWGGEDSEFAQRLFNAGLWRKNVKFSAIQYHIYHKENNLPSESIRILNNTVEKALSWCVNGINKHK
jgi:glycosyltransferase involved in cell wall biosynthesis